MTWEYILQALIVAVITALATSYVNVKVMEARLADMKDRVIRIEEEVKIVRARLHDLGNRVSEVIALGRWIEEDRRNK